MAPPSPYSATQAVAGLNQSGASTSRITPQRGMYDVNGYAGTSVPLSSGYNSAASSFEPPADYPMPGSGYSPPAYDTNASAQYAIGGSYDIQGQTQASIPGAPAYSTPSPSYATNAAPYGYQLPPASTQGSGYNPGPVQEPYGSPSAPSYSGPTSNSLPTADGYYAGGGYGYPAGDSNDVNSVATLPKLPPAAPKYESNQPPYVPGQSNYNPPNTPQYTPPAPGGYVQPATATEPSYAPGSVSRYPSSSMTSPTTGGYNSTGIY